VECWAARLPDGKEKAGGRPKPGCRPLVGDRLRAHFSRAWRMMEPRRVFWKCAEGPYVSALRAIHSMSNRRVDFRRCSTASGDRTCRGRLFGSKSCLPTAIRARRGTWRPRTVEGQSPRRKGGALLFWPAPQRAWLSRLGRQDYGPDLHCAFDGIGVPRGRWRGAGPEMRQESVEGTIPPLCEIGSTYSYAGRTAILHSADPVFDAQRFPTSLLPNSTPSSFRATGPTLLRSA